MSIVVALHGGIQINATKLCEEVFVPGWMLRVAVAIGLLFLIGFKFFQTLSLSYLKSLDDLRKGIWANGGLLSCVLLGGVGRGIGRCIGRGCGELKGRG